jgi:hypothetical protein
MDNHILVETEIALARERAKTALLAKEIRDVRLRSESSNRIAAATITEFPSGSLGQKYGTIGSQHQNRR